MTKEEKKPENKKDEHWWECDCVNSDIGAHERCKSSKCHMPKWKDIKRGPKKGSH